MSNFIEEAGRCIPLVLSFLDDLEKCADDELQSSGSTKHVRYLQSVSMQRNIIACGLFSLFESSMQAKVGGEKTLTKLRKMLKDNGKVDLCDRLLIFETVNNILKHGIGDSHRKFENRTDAFSINIRNKYFHSADGDISNCASIANIKSEYIFDMLETLNEIEIIVRSNIY